ncbi:hypothetical protein LTR15_011208 [Elasticomyces elasticus]|nr:hypothetical protein LTR15_011208 [Elasticomyces elasticus]
MSFFVHAHGSLDSRIIAAIHYPSFAGCSQPYDRSINDPKNPCIAWLYRYFGGLHDMYLFNSRPVRMRRADRDHKVWRDELDAAALAQFAEEFKSQWNASSAVVGIVFGAENAKIYKHQVKNKLALSLRKRKMYGEAHHAYLELDDDGAPRRLTFLVYHPEGYQYLRGAGEGTRAEVQRTARLQYEVCFSVAYPGQPIPKFTPRPPGKAAHYAQQTLDELGAVGMTFDFGDPSASPTERLYHRVRYLINLELSLGVSFTAAKVPADV